MWMNIRESSHVHHAMAAMIDVPLCAVIVKNKIK